MVAKFDHGRSSEQSVRVDNQLTVLERVDITLYQQEVRAGLDWQETRTRNIYAMGVLEVLNCGTRGSLELIIGFKHD